MDLSRIDSLPLQKVALDAILWDDRRFELRTARPHDGDEKMVRSIQGELRTPPLLRSVPGGWQIVRGFARLRVLREARPMPEQVTARVCGPETPDFDLLRGAVAENMETRGLNAIEKFVAMDLGRRFLEEKGLDPDSAKALLIKKLFPLMDLAPSNQSMERLLELGRLDGTAARAVAGNELPENAALTLLDLPPESRDALVHAGLSLRLSAGMWRDFTREAVEVLGRDKMSVRELLNEIEWRETPPEGADSAAWRKRVLERLHRLRMPILTRLEERWDTTLKSLRLPSCVKLSPPRDFEGDRFRVEIDVRSVEELRAAVEALSRALYGKPDELRRLFDTASLLDEPIPAPNERLK